MRILATIAVTVLTMTMLSSGAVSAAVTPASDQTVAPTTIQERKDQRTLASRNAAAKKLKAELDKKNAALSIQAK
ncbi:MAG TPA: hypothetical protein HPP94_16245 [Desulfuromonadales bacterium]|nr:hypothetical protein [Desulfuromonadales bacterium]